MGQGSQDHYIHSVELLPEPYAVDVHSLGVKATTGVRTDNGRRNQAEQAERVANFGPSDYRIRR